MRYLFYTLVIFIFTACSLPEPYMKTNTDSIVLRSNNHSVELQTKGLSYHGMFGYLDKRFFFENNQYQIEYMQLEHNCNWTGDEDGFYQDFLDDNIKGLKKTSSIKVNNGDIYKFNKGNEYFYLISLYDIRSNIFVIDYTGDIVSKLLDKDLTINPINQLQPRLKKEFLKNYMFKHYFERESNEPEIINK